MDKEEKCWCQYPEEDRIPFWRKTSVWVTPETGKPIKFEIQCCPVCGSKLDDLWAHA